MGRYVIYDPIVSYLYRIGGFSPFIYWDEIDLVSLIDTASAMLYCDSLSLDPFLEASAERD